MPWPYWGSAYGYNFGVLNGLTVLYFNDFTPNGATEAYVAFSGYWFGASWAWPCTFVHYGGYKQNVGRAPTFGPWTWATYKAGQYPGPETVNAFGSGAALTLFG